MQSTSNSQSQAAASACSWCGETQCQIWCLREIDRRLVAAGWNPISDWWWNVLERSRGVRNVVVRGGRRGGKSTTVCRFAVAEMLDPKHNVPPGDIGYFAIISATLPQAKERILTIAKILDVLEVPHKALTEQIMLHERATGAKAFAATLKGVVSFTAIGALCDEEARWQDPDSGANPANEVLSSLRPTMTTMPNAQMWHVSSPWSTIDVHHLMVEAGDNEAQRVFCGATWEMNPTVTEADTKALEPDYPSWLREYAAQPMASDETKFFPAEFVDAAGKLSFQFEYIEKTRGGGDFAFRKNSSALAVLQQMGVRVRLVANEERVPGKRALIPSETITDLVGLAASHGADGVACDLHYIETVREHTEALDLELLEFPTDSEGINKAYVRTRVMLSHGWLDLSRASPMLLKQLKETTSKPTDGAGLIIKNPVKNGAHGDNVSALVAAVWALDQQTLDRKAAFGARRYPRGGSQKTSGKLTDYPTAEDLD